MIEYTVRVYDDAKYWFLNGKIHRTDGPAIEWSNGTKSWYLNNKLHREDGPALERADGAKEWWLNGIEYTEDEFNKRTQVKEMTIKELEDILGYTIKVVK